MACAVAEAQPQAPTSASIAEAMSTMRTYVKFTFFKLSPEWQRRDTELRAQDKREFLAACEDFATDRSLRAYSTVGTRGDTDLLILSQSPVLDDLHNFHVVLAQSRSRAMGDHPPFVPGDDEAVALLQLRGAPRDLRLRAQVPVHLPT